MEYLAVALAALTVLVFVLKLVAKRTKTTVDDKVAELVEKYGDEAVKWALAQLDKRRAKTEPKA